MASSGNLSQALRSITTIKLNQLKQEQATFEKSKQDLVRAADKTPNWRQKVRILLDGLKDIPSIKTSDLAAALLPDSIDQILAQAEYDASISQAILEGWVTKIKRSLKNRTSRFDYASLYGQLVLEWVINSESGSAINTKSTLISQDNEEAHQQRKEWESYVFQALDTDTQEIKEYLERVFCSTEQSRAGLKSLRAGVKAFEDEFKASKQVNLKTLNWCIEGLKRSDLLTEEKRAMLVDWNKEKTVLNDLADMMNTRLTSLDKLLRPQSVVAEQRRNLDGKYRIFHDEDLLDSLLLRYLGVKWSVHFNRALTRFSEENSWTTVPKSRRPITLGNDRREYFLDGKAFPQSVEAKTAEYFHDHFFLTQLIKDETEIDRAYEGDEQDEDANEGLKVRDSPSDLKHSLLHLLSTEIITKTTLHGGLAIVRTDFKSFGPSLSHSTLFTTLKFFGVSEDWVSFFKRALEVPLRFADDPTGAVRIRKRGTGLSSPLADVCGELLMYCLDVAVFQQTNGMRLWRLHDDFWFWGPESVCVTAWKTMEEFAKLMGLEFNRDKTGSRTITGAARRSHTPDPPHLRVFNGDLPSGDIRWGFLVLDLTGRFVIDDAMVDKHISGLRMQLSSCNSVLEWIQVYNAYAVRFYSAMFGRPSNAFGRHHITMALSTFNRVQKTIFDKATLIDFGERSVSEYLKAMIERKFGTTSIPDGFLYFPTLLGGLDLRNPFIPLALIEKQVLENPDSLMNDFWRREKTAYEGAKTAFENEYRKIMRSAIPGQVMKRPNLQYIPPNPSQFFSFEEYSADPERNSLELYKIYKELLKTPKAGGNLKGQEDPKSISEGSTREAGLGLTAYVNQLESFNLTPYN